MISHDLSVLADLCDRIAVMYAGRVVEHGPAGKVFTDPLHPYAHALVGVVPADRRPRGALRAGRPAGRPARPGRAAVGLRVPPALPEAVRRLRPGGARAARRRDQGRGLPARGRVSRDRRSASSTDASALLEARGLSIRFQGRGGPVARAVDGVDLSIAAGEIVALVGESGSGKTTLGAGAARPGAALGAARCCSTASRSTGRPAG